MLKGGAPLLPPRNLYLDLPYKFTSFKFDLQPGRLTVQVAGENSHTENIHKL